MLSIAAPRALSLTTPRSRQHIFLYIALSICLLFVFIRTEFGHTVITRVADHTSTHLTKGPHATPTPKTPKYKPQPTYTPPPVKDPFPMLMHSNPPPVPSWNRPKKPNVYHKYDIVSVAPPLLIGFTRSWPMLLQTVVGYVTAGWPAEQIYVVENTGVQDANARGKLSLQNPLYLNHTQLHMLGVNIIRTPVLLNFAQLQNYFVSVAKDKPWPYYFWSHMDSFVMSYEEGLEGVSGPINSSSYQTIYDLAVKELNHTLRTDPKWGARFFAYDHLALVNPKAYEAVGGWDTFIPYYMTDCDMHWRLEEAGYSMKEAKAGIVQDVASTLDDLRVLYREGDIPDGFGFTDPNPPPPKKTGSPKKGRTKRRDIPEENVAHVPKAGDGAAVDTASKSPRVIDPLKSFRALHRISQDMFNHKHADRDRNTWQVGQRGGDMKEPYAYDAYGFQVGIDVMTEAGREVFRRKWGHRGCDFAAAGLHPADAWKVEKDWE